MMTTLRSALLVTLACLAIFHTVQCKSGNGDGDMWITYESPDGETLYLQDNRRPSLYTGNYGDCLGNSLVNVTRFDAAYYKDNMTVLFHLAGNTAIHNESLVMYIGVYAYGESRFDLTFNPCHANIASLCPLNSSVPISANGIIPVAESDVSSIPPLALRIPDFEGQAILRIFANSTQSEIGCYSAVVTNGHSFAQPKSVGVVLGIFTFIAMIASFGTAIYGEAIPTMRLHYAHSLSVGVVFAVFQHIFFTGALSMNWPSVLVAWWHNFAWSGGMIFNASMQNSINQLIGNVVGNTSQVGAAPSDSANVNVGGGYDISQIYRRALVPRYESTADLVIVRDMASEIYKDANSSMVYSRTLQARDYLVNKTDGYRWYGNPIGPGMPLPGNYSGFSGTLAEENIRISNAFITGFLWFLILLALLVVGATTFKGTLEALSRAKLMKHDRLKFFRDHWVGCTTVVALRTCYVGFFLIMFLTFFEFSVNSSAGVKVVAIVVFLVFLAGIPGAAAYACYYKKYSIKDSPNNPVERKNLLGIIPWYVPNKLAAGSDNATTGTEQAKKEHAGKPLWRRMVSAKHATDSPVEVDNIHDNDDYTMKFGWLASRFRRRRWWFFTSSLLYESVRAVFYAGASSYPLAQVFCLLILELLAFAYIIWAQPFEGRRLNIIVVYCLGFSKVASVALSATFDVQFNLPRITTTVIAIAIIVIQGLLTIITMIAVVVGAISSYMSISRNHEDFRPRRWHGLREKYFDHLDRIVNDLPPKPTVKGLSKRQSSRPNEQQYGFEIRSVRRMAKIEDEDALFASEMNTQDVTASYLSLNEEALTPFNASVTAVGSQRSRVTTPVPRSRAGSLKSLSHTNLPYGARPHIPSWSARDFSPLQGNDADLIYMPIEDGINDENSVIVPAQGRCGCSRASSTTPNAKPNSNVYRQLSTDSLDGGADFSTRQIIENVPTPTVRLRSGTTGSLRSSRASSPEPGPTEEGIDDGIRARFWRSSKYQPQMTPAQELEESSNSSKSSQVIARY